MTTSTEGRDYAERLLAMQNVWWKRMLHVQAPYAWNLRRQGLGRTLDVGCGIGRNLRMLPSGSVGVDHNPHAVDICREQGFAAMTVEEFFASEHSRSASFDSMVLSHVIEHLDHDESLDLVRGYLPCIRPGGRVMVIVPQEVGYRSDPTHVHFYDQSTVRAWAREVGLDPIRIWSFPFPRPVGRVFIYNETCMLARLPDAPGS